MYKKLSYLLAYCILLSGSLSASSLFAPSNFDPEESTRFTITYKIFKPSRVYGVSTSDPNAQVSANEYQGGFGFAVNSLNFEYSKMYDNGERIVGYFTFFNNAPVNPYIGISYIQHTELRDVATKSKVDGADPLVGIQFSYFKYINPYFEYMPVSALWVFGVRFQLHAIVDKRDSISAASDIKKQEYGPVDLAPTEGVKPDSTTVKPK
jgi:hypothetical protein